MRQPAYAQRGAFGSLLSKRPMYCTCGGPGSIGWLPPELDPPLLPPPLLPPVSPLDPVPPLLPAPPVPPGSDPGFDVDGDPSSPVLDEPPELHAIRREMRSAGRRTREYMT
jgi:hypothetical protein